MVAESINDPAVGELVPGSGHDDVVVATDELYGAPAAGSDVSFAGITASAAGSSGRLYAIDGKTGRILPGWPVKMPGIIQNELPLIGPGQDASIVKVGGKPEIVASVTGGALEELSVAGKVNMTAEGCVSVSVASEPGSLARTTFPGSTRRTPMRPSLGAVIVVYSSWVWAVWIIAS